MFQELRKQRVSVFVYLYGSPRWPNGFCFTQSASGRPQHYEGIAIPGSFRQLRQIKSPRKSMEYRGLVTSTPTRLLPARLALHSKMPLKSIDHQVFSIELVEVRGFEPLAFSLRTRRSTN